MRKPNKVSLKGEPTFLYLSVCCNERADKPPCTKVDKKAALTNSLGSWRCKKCNKSCKVSRSKNVPQRPEETNG